MARKSSFVMYAEYLTQIRRLSREQRGDLFTAILQYAAGMELPEMEAVTSMAFSFIQERMDKDAEKYQKTVEARREAGRLGGIAKQANATFAKQNVANGSKAKQTVANLHDNDSVYDNDNVIDNDYIGVINNSTKFVPPTPEQVRAYSTEKGYNIDAERFVDFYASKGWMVGKNKMKDWKAAVRNWAKSQRQEVTTKGNGNKFNNFSQRQYDYDKLENQLLEAQGKG